MACFYLILLTCCIHTHTHERTHNSTSLWHVDNPHRERQDSPITAPPLGEPKQTLSLSARGLITFSISRLCKTLGARQGAIRERLTLTARHSRGYIWKPRSQTQGWRTSEKFFFFFLFSVINTGRRHNSIATLLIFLLSIKHLSNKVHFFPRHLTRQHLALTLGFNKRNSKSHMCPLKRPFVC